MYAILDLPYPHAIPVESVVEALLEGGAAVVQLRAKQASSEQRRAWAQAIAGPCRVAGVPLILNDDLALAESGTPGIAGVHLGQTDLDRLGPDLETRARRRAELRERGLVLGVSTHSPAQVGQSLVELDPDYMGFGPVFPTTTKLDADPIVGLDWLAAVCAQSSTPIVAIGGIDPHRALSLRSTGVAAIAVIGALVGPTPASVRSQTEALVRSFTG